MINKNIKSEFAKNVFTLMSGTAIAQVIPLLFYPILSRIFNESDYATYGLYMGIFEFLAIIIAGRYELTIILPEKESSANDLVLGSIFFAFTLSFVIFLIVLFFRTEISLLLNNLNLSPFLFFLPITLFIYSINRVLTHWLIRKKDFKSISFNKIFHKSSETVFSSTLGIFKINNGLILGDLIGRTILLFFTIRASLKNGILLHQFFLKNTISVLKKYKEFPIYNSIPALSNSLANILPVFLISAYFDEVSSGNFNFSRLILAAPLALVSSSISQVLSQKLSQKYNNKETVKGIIISVTKKISLLAILLILSLTVGGPLLFRYIFGEKWILAGEFSQTLVYSYGIQFVLVSLYPIFYIFNSIKISSAWQIFYLISITSLYLIPRDDINLFINTYVSIVVIAFIIYAILIYYVINKYEKLIQ